MSVQDILNQFNGAILANKARVTFNGKSIVVGQFVGSELVMTDAGRALLQYVQPTVAPEPAPTKKTRAKKSAVVESTEESSAE